MFDVSSSDTISYFVCACDEGGQMNKIFLASSLLVFTGMAEAKRLTKEDCVAIKRAADFGIKDVIKAEKFKLFMKSITPKFSGDLDWFARPGYYDTTSRTAVAKYWARHCTKPLSNAKTVTVKIDNPVTVTVKSKPLIKYKLATVTVKSNPVTITNWAAGTATISITTYGGTLNTTITETKYHTRGYIVIPIGLLIALGAYHYYRREDDKKELNKLNLKIERDENTITQLSEDLTKVKLEYAEAVNGKYNELREFENMRREALKEAEQLREQLNDYKEMDEAIKNYHDEKCKLITQYETQIRVLNSKCDVLESTNVNAQNIKNFADICLVHGFAMERGERNTAQDRPALYMHMLQNGKAYVGIAKNAPPRKRWDCGKSIDNELNGYNAQFTSDMWKFGGPRFVQTVWAYVPEDWSKHQMEAVESELILLGKYASSSGYNINR